MTICGRSHRNVHDSTVPEISHGNSAAVKQQVGSRGVAGFEKSSVAIVAEIAIAFPAVPRRTSEMFRIKEDAGLILFLAGYYVIEKVELYFRVFVVVDPAIRRVGILPSIIVEIGECRS